MSKSWPRVRSGLFVMSASLAFVGCSSEPATPPPAPPPATPPATPPPATPPASTPVPPP
jgi:hypothetical protein